MAESAFIRPYVPKPYPKLEQADHRYIAQELQKLSSSVSSVRKAVSNIEAPAPVTVASLPVASSSTGIRLMASDANATTFWSIVAGGGANVVPVTSDGTNWRIG